MFTLNSHFIFTFTVWDRGIFCPHFVQLSNSVSIRTICLFHYSLPPQFLSFKLENLRQSNRVGAHLLAPCLWPCHTHRCPPRGRRRRGWGWRQGCSPTATGACTVDEGGPDRCDSMRDISQVTLVRPNAPASLCSLRPCAWWVRFKTVCQGWILGW